MIAWQHIENYQPYHVPVGPVTGYRTISDWIESEGLLQREYFYGDKFSDQGIGNEKTAQYEK